MTTKKPIELDDETRAALLRLVKRYGRRWKAELRIAWYQCSTRDLDIPDDDESVLIRMRNTVGPSGLNAIRTADVTQPVGAEVAATRGRRRSR